MKIPFPLVHIDTGHNFPEAIAYRDALAERIGAELIVRQVEDTNQGERDSLNLRVSLPLATGYKRILFWIPLRSSSLMPV